MTCEIESCKTLKTLYYGYVQPCQQLIEPYEADGPIPDPCKIKAKNVIVAINAKK